jgi:nucleoside-diphosphate-sugar epimerase
VLVTGSSGLIGRAVVADLTEAGYKVTGADITLDHSSTGRLVNFEDLGQVIGEINGHDSVIHLAAIPSPETHPPEVVFRRNVITTFNVLEAASITGINNVVMASSLSALGFAFCHRAFNPTRVPIDETHPLLSQDAYGLSKMIGEHVAQGFIRRVPEMSLKSLRFTTVLGENQRGEIRLARKEGGGNPGAFWTYVDVRDAATSCRLAMEYRGAGHEAFYIGAPRIFACEPIEDLLAKHFPGDYPIADDLLGNMSPVDCRKAEALLGWNARYGWDGNEL